MDRAAQDHRWLRSLDADMERSLATGELRMGVRDGEAHDEGGGIVANAPRWAQTGILYRLECLENALLDSERQHRAACEREEFWKRRAERYGTALFVLGLAALVIAGAWIVAKF